GRAQQPGRSASSAGRSASDALPRDHGPVGVAAAGARLCRGDARAARARQLLPQVGVGVHVDGKGSRARAPKPRPHPLQRPCSLPRLQPAGLRALGRAARLPAAVPRRDCRRRHRSLRPARARAPPHKQAHCASARCAQLPPRRRRRGGAALPRDRLPRGAVRQPRRDQGGGHDRVGARKLRDARIVCRAVCGPRTAGAPCGLCACGGW
ncbi:hypothetical protein EMIHUDRAFT_451559, partial [Emiliania huxleyi CCMP1516]